MPENCLLTVSSGDTWNEVFYETGNLNTNKFCRIFSQI